MGAELDSETVVDLIPDTSTLIVRTQSSADSTTFSSLAEIVNSRVPLQFKTSTTVIDLPPNINLDLVFNSHFNPSELENFLSRASSIEGVNISNLPHTLSRNGETSKIQIGKELILPNELHKEHFIGLQLSVQSNLFGLGQEVEIKLDDTKLLDNTFEITSLANFDDKVFSPDNNSRILQKKSSDGSQTLFFVSTTPIDAAGKPYREIQ